MHKNAKPKIRRLIGCSVVAALLAMNYMPAMQNLKQLPSEIYVSPGQTAILPDTGKWIATREESIAVDSQSAQRLSDVQPGASKIKSKIQYDLLGVVPIKTVSIVEREQIRIIPGGCSVGVTMHTRGALVVGITEIITNTGEICNPSKAAGLQPGDVIEKTGGKTIRDADHLTELVESSGGKSIEMEITRKGQKLKLSIVPALDKQDGRYRLGLWARDSTAGVGTMTFYDPATGMYGALGHAITDLDTKERLQLKNGELIQSNIVDIRHGLRGTPGELKGSFESGKKKLGTIEKNTEFGIFGKLYEPYSNPIYTEPIPVAAQDEAKTAPAEILTTLNNGIHAFKCEIERISPQTRPSPKGMIVRITDPQLLGATGGIVQGMSGSPIIQNGKIVGAVTHVFVNDPTRGYGMFIEWMLDQERN